MNESVTRGTATSLVSSVASIITTTAGELVDGGGNDPPGTRQSNFPMPPRIEISSAFELATLFANLPQSEHFSIEMELN